MVHSKSLFGGTWDGSNLRVDLQQQTADSGERVCHVCLGLGLGSWPRSFEAGNQPAQNRRTEGELSAGLSPDPLHHPPRSVTARLLLAGMIAKEGAQAQASPEGRRAFRRYSGSGRRVAGRVFRRAGGDRASQRAAAGRALRREPGGAPPRAAGSPSSARRGTAPSPRPRRPRPLLPPAAPAGSLPASRTAPLRPFPRGRWRGIERRAPR